MSDQQRRRLAELLAESFVNGNRSATVVAITEESTTLAAAVLAIEVLQVLRESHGEGEADSWQRALRYRL